MKYPGLNSTKFIPWQPSTWPEPPATFDIGFHKNLKRILNETILKEIYNVISDAQSSGQGLVHRGHVVALAMLCAIDAISSYAFPKKNEECKKCGRSDHIGPKYKRFISDFFPQDYKPFAKAIYNLYRNSMVHSWNLFKVGILPGNQPISKKDGTISFGLLNFFDALKKATKNFLLCLTDNPALQMASLKRYKELKDSALP